MASKQRVIRKKSSSVIPSVIKGPSDTMAFVKDPEQYLKKKCSKYGDIFGGRIFHWSILFATSYEAVQQVFSDERTFFFNEGYSGFSGMVGLFQRTSLFLNQPEASIERMRLEDCKLFSSPHVQNEILPRVTEVITAFQTQLAKSCATSDDGQFTFGVYKAIKTLNVDIMCHLFLGKSIVAGGSVSKGQSAAHVVDDAQHVEKLSSILWKGMQSLGYKYGGLVKSAYGNGEGARNELLKMYHEAIGQSGQDTPHTSKCPFISIQAPSVTHEKSKATSSWVSTLSREEAGRYFIMTSSSMVTKAIASIVTSFLIQLSLPENQSILESLRVAQGSERELLELRKVLCEVQRLFPPVVGCCRGSNSAKESRTNSEGPLGMHDFAKGTKIWCSFLNANRDPRIYESPLKFDPSRWNCTCEESVCSMKQIPCAQVPAPCTFGGGVRQCPGKPFANTVLEQICGMLIRNFNWRLVIDKEEALKYRWLPVAKPKEVALFQFSCRESGS